MKAIFLTGYMASGKTTLGRALARELGLGFIDIDFFIEQRFHMKVSGIFASKGEAEFRRMEAAALREVGEMEDVVVSCGGGTPCFGDNMDWMNAHGVTVFLDAGVRRIAARVLAQPGKRPLLAGKTPDELEAHIAAHLAERMPFYSRARLRLDSDRLESRAQIADAVAELSRQLQSLDL